MGVWEIVLIVACALLVVGVVTARLVRKAKGKSTCDCGCDCAHCRGCSLCGEGKEREKNIAQIGK